MELEDLKNTWNKYDVKLANNLRINEELLRKMNLNTSRKEMQKLVNYEVFNLVILIIIIPMTLSFALYNLDQIKFYLPGFISSIISIVFFYFSVIKLRDIVRIDYYGSPVVKVQRDILTVKKKVLEFRKWEFILLPLFVLPLLPVLFMIVHGIDIYKDMTLFIIEIIAILGLGYPLLIWVYKYFYDKKFKNAENLLSELDKFEKEEK